MAPTRARSDRPLTSKQVETLLSASASRAPDPLALAVAKLEEGFEAPAASLAPRSIEALVESDPKTYDAARRQVRDRYIAARFEGVARSGEDLRDAPRVIKAARLQFEEGQPDNALELLELAIEQSPHEPSFWLAEMELAFLMRDAQRFVESARAFRAAHPRHRAWLDIERLGHALAPGDDLFRDLGERAHEHYGPWPNLPNWIGAPWDLTGEVLASDFHMAMARDGRD